MAMHLFELKYDDDMSPWFYAAEDQQAALQAAHEDDRDEYFLLSVRQLPDDELVEYGASEEYETEDGFAYREVQRKETAGQIAANATVAQCMLCDREFAE